MKRIPVTGNNPVVVDKKIQEFVDRQHEKMFGKWEWKLVFTIFPKKCCITGNYTRGLCKVYKGVRRSSIVPYSPPSIKYVSKEAFLFAQLKGDKIA